MRLAVFTICSNRHVPQAEVLFQTVGRFLPEADRVLILADTRHPGLRTPAGCEVVTADALGIADFREFAFRYDAKEFAAALKPFAFLHLLERRGATHCLYFDPDIELHSPLASVMDALGDDASFVLTPQILAPAAEETDIAIMREGVFNLGFLGVSRTEEALSLLRWWSRWLLRHCYDDRPIGMFIDQKFMDLLPGFARNARILHDPGLNLGHRNLAQRRFVPEAPGGPEVDGRPLGFFHYGGFDPDMMAENMRDFLAAHARRLEQAGRGLVPDASAYARFASGVPIPAIARRLFRDDREAWAGDPFETFEAWAHLPAREVQLGLGSTMPSMAMHWLHARTPALAGFSLADPAGAVHVTRWWLQHGEALGIDRRFLEPQALAAGLRGISPGAHCPAPDPARADIAVIGAGAVAEAVWTSLSQAGLRVERWAPDAPVPASAPVTARILCVCVPADRLAGLLDRARTWPHSYRILVPSEQGAPTQGFDEIWAPTRFLQAAYVLAAEMPVLHMPLACAAIPAPSGPDPRYILADGDGDALLASIGAYVTAFASRPETGRPELLISPHDLSRDAALHAAIAETPGVAVSEVPLFETKLSGAACLLSLHRHDPLGLSVSRAMAAGVPVVASDTGGCTDLLTPETGFPVDGGIGHAAWLLRCVFDRPDEARLRAGAARARLLRERDPTAIAALQRHRLTALGLVASQGQDAS